MRLSVSPPVVVMMGWRRQHKRRPGQSRGQLHVAGAAVFRLEVARDDERPALGQRRRNAQLATPVS